MFQQIRGQGSELSDMCFSSVKVVILAAQSTGTFDVLEFMMFYFLKNRVENKLAENQESKDITKYSYHISSCIFIIITNNIMTHIP